MEIHFHQKHNQMTHESPAKSLSPHSSHASFPIIAVAIIGIFATIFLLVFYYIFVIKCCLNWHRIDILRRFSLSRNRNHHQPLVPHHLPSPEPRGLHESVIRSIPIFQFQKQKDSDDIVGECAVCLAEFQHDEKLRMIPNCAHVFHIDCIDVWLQNNPNCPLCRNSISISIPPHFPVPDHQQLIPPPALDEEDYVVIDLCSSNGNGGGGSNGQTNDGEDLQPISGEPIAITPSPRKKMGKKLRKKYGLLSSMGDECIDVSSRRKGDDQFSIQPIRRSFSMDSASDRQLYLAVQEIIQRNQMNNVEAIESIHECSSTGTGSSRLKRGFFSFGHARSAVLPLHLKT
ncbi:RING-H2 finger protein ATL16 [Lactuca sativa]|nr:RING-H2 finger protein ATL16 [Lactuca sativa]